MLYFDLNPVIAALEFLFDLNLVIAFCVLFVRYVDRFGVLF